VQAKSLINYLSVIESKQNEECSAKIIYLLTQSSLDSRKEVTFEGLIKHIFPLKRSLPIND